MVRMSGISPAHSEFTDCSNSRTLALQLMWMAVKLMLGSKGDFPLIGRVCIFHKKGNSTNISPICY